MIKEPIIMTDTQKLTSIIQHIKRVEDNCNIISRKMMDINPRFAIAIAKRGRVHDASKFDQLEFENLWEGSKCFEIAILNHHCHNSHHPEFYRNGIHGMSELDLAEMVCDCTARAQEFGKDVRIWFFSEDKAPKKYGYVGEQDIYDRLEYYINMLLNKSF
jgi:hypothetical protein